MQNRFLLIGHGVSGSGKTTAGNALVEALGVVQVRSDVERKRLFELDKLATSGSDIDGGIYSPAASQKTYERLESLTKQILRSGYAVFIDATNLKQSQRDHFSNIAEEEGVASILISCTADKETLKAWITSRAKQANDASEATIEVMERQLENQDPLTDEEKSHAIIINTSDKAELESVVQTIKKRLGL